MSDGSVRAGARISNNIKELRRLAEGPGGVGGGICVVVSVSAKNKAGRAEAGKASGFSYFCCGAVGFQRLCGASFGICKAVPSCITAALNPNQPTLTAQINPIRDRLRGAVAGIQKGAEYVLDVDRR